MTKEDLKKLLSSFKEEDFFENVDLHIHSKYSDGKLSPDKIVKQARRLQKQYISICDHNNVQAYIETNVLRESIVIPAVEFDCYYRGNIIHILGYGINIDNRDIKSICTTNFLGRKSTIYRLFHLRNPKTVIEIIKKSGGIAVLAHPGCYFSRDFDSFIKDLVDMGIEGLEVYYKYRFLRRLLKFRSVNVISHIADNYGLIKTGGTDSHGRYLLK